MTKPSLIITPRRPALLSGFDNTVDILVRVQAPPMPASAPVRSPLNLAIVLDRSGSMGGQPLEEAKRCAGFIIDRLGPQDRAALVVYDRYVNVLVPATTVADRSHFQNAIRRIESGGSTNLHGGWLKGAELVAGLTSSDSITRVLLLSDGQANAGITGISEIADQCAQLADAGVTTSTYGLGREFNEDLMIRMARAGRGNSYYGETAQDLMDPFTEEFDLLAAMFAKDVVLKVDAAPFTKFTVMNKFAESRNGGLHMPNLAYDSEGWAVIRIKLPKEQTGNGDGQTLVNLGSLGLSYKDLDGTDHTLETCRISLPSLLPAAWGAVSEDQLVARRVSELEAADIQDRAQNAARRRDWPEVRRLLHEARENAKDNEWLAQVVETLEKLAERGDEAVFAKEASYSSLRMRSRVAGLHEDSTNASAAENAPSFLRRKRQQGKADPKAE